MFKHRPGSTSSLRFHLYSTQRKHSITEIMEPHSYGDELSSGEVSSETTQIKCKNCGQLSVQQDTQGTLDIMVCGDCGWSEEVTFGTTDGNQGYPMAANVFSGEGPVRLGKFYLPKNYERAKAINFVRLLKEMAHKVNLPEHETKQCEGEGKDLLKRKEFGTILKTSTAGLVFIALQRNSPSISLKEVAEKLDIKLKSLGRVVKDLKRQPSVSKPKREFTDEERIQAAMDRIPSSVSMDTRIKAKQMAVEIKEICGGRNVQGNFVSGGLPLDCAIVIIAMEAVEKKKITDKWIADYAKNTNLQVQSFKTKVREVRTILLSLAEEIPSIGSKVKSNEITVRNIQRYVPVIVQNKAFLTIDPDQERSEECSDGAKAGGTFLNEDHYVHHEDESDDNLSDLDDEIKQYIATDKEVARKQKMQQL